MPELPEVEIIRRGLEPVLVGARIAKLEQRRLDLRVPLPKDFAKRLAGRRIEAVGRRAKYLLIDLDDGAALVIHLGMTGSLRIERSGKDRVAPGAFHYARGKDALHDHIVFHLSNGATITYNDVRRFGLMTLVLRSELADHPLFKHLGIEPLGNELDRTALARLFGRKAAPLKAALVDQRLVAGLGNIYACEALHRAHLSPLRAARTIATKSGAANARAERLAQAIRDVLEEALGAGGSSIRDYRQADGNSGSFQENFRVYDREHEPCPTPGCRGVIQRIVQSGRSTFFCPRCQK
jgi:formamidopyrimidine-DNA glycosylase